MKKIIIILTLIVSIQSFGQKAPEIELKNIFYSLPIESGIEVIIDSAKNTELISLYDTLIVIDELYFTGHFYKNNYVLIEFISGQIEIFRAENWTLNGVVVDTMDIMVLYFNYGNEVTKDIRKEYNKLIKTFKGITKANKEYETYADSGLVRYGYLFFKSENDKLPFMSIEIGLGDCISNTKSLIIKYYKI